MRRARVGRRRPRSRLSGLSRLVGMAGAVALVGCASGDLAGSAAAPAGAAAVATGAASPGPRSAPDDEDLLGVVPDGTETVIDVDVAQLRTSAWSQRLVAAPDDERAARTTAQGFDEITDVDRALFAVSEAAAAADTAAPGAAEAGAAEGGGAGGGPTTLTIARGRFDQGRIGRALGAGWAATSWRGSRVWQQGDRALALLTSRTLIRGEPASVRAAIDCAWGLAPDMRSSAVGELQRQLVARSERPAAVIAAATVTQAMRRRVENEFALPVGLQRAGARLDLGGALELELYGLLANPREAGEMAHNLDVTVRDLRARRALAAFGLSAFLRGVTVTPQGRAVSARLTLPEEQREDLAAKLAFVLEAIRARPR